MDSSLSQSRNPLHKSPSLPWRLPSMSKKEKDTKTLYQLLQELEDAEKKLFHLYDFPQFIDYLDKMEYKNYDTSVYFVPPNEQVDEYNLLAKKKIDSQLQFLVELFELKRKKHFHNQTHVTGKCLDDLFDAFEKHYVTQIKNAKKYSK
jgi:hypothetical protein